MDKKVKILLVEDDEILSKVIFEDFEEAGFLLDRVSDGDSGIRAIRSSAPDLVLLDILMPKKDGFEVLEELRKDENLRRIPVIVLSNLGHDEDIKKAMELGAVDYFVKSNWTIDEVVKKIEKYLGERKV